MIPAQLSDDRLEDWFAAAASAYEVPGEAVDRVLAAAGEAVAPRRRLEHPRLVAAGLLLVAAAGGTALWSGHDGGTRASVGAVPAAGSAVVNGGPLQATPLSAGLTAKRVIGTTENGTDATTPEYKGVHGAPAAGVSDGAKIVHTGSVGLIVAKGQVTPVLSQLTGLADGVSGYVASTTTAETGAAPTGTIVLRVPAGSYDTVLAQVRGLGTVTATTSSGVDVTAQVTDQQARMTALKATRGQYLAILAKTTTIGQTLSVQEQVDEVQTQIDQLQGQINVLADQASYGTLTVTVTQKSAVVVPPKPAPRQSGLSNAWDRAKTGFVTGIEALVARSGRALVLLLVLLAGGAVLRVAWRVSRRRMV